MAGGLAGGVFSRSAHVAAPTIPSAVSPSTAWNSSTAILAATPKSPLTATRGWTFHAFSRAWSSLTARPVEPSRNVGLTDRNEPIHTGTVAAVMPTRTARQIRTTRHLALRFFGLIVISKQFGERGAASAEAEFLWWGPVAG